MEKAYKKMKFSIVMAIICSILIIGIIIYMFFSSKASESIYANSNVVNLEKDGIKTEEFNSFLKIISLLVNEEYEDLYGIDEIENIRILDSAFSFINITGEGASDLNENGNYEYDANIVNKIIQEINGLSIQKSIPTGNKYTYNEEKNVYSVFENNTIAACEIIEIEKFEKKDKKIDVVYKCYLGEKDSIYKIKAILVENSEYEYSKYFVNTIEKISQ